MLLMLTTLSQAQDAQLHVQVPASTPGSILVDGQDTGVQAPGTVGVPAGDHTIQVNGECVSASQSVSVSAGQELSLTLTPQPLGGLALLSLSPAEAVLSVDGAQVTVDGGLALTCGPHTLSASAPGFQAETQELDVEMGGAYRVSFSLTAYSSEPVTGPGDTVDDPGDAVGTDPIVTDPVAPDPVGPAKQRNTSLIAGGALTAVGAGVFLAGGVVRAGALSDYKELSALDANGDGIIRTPEDTQLASELWDNSVGPARTRSMALFAVGGVLMATGTGVMVLVDEQGQPILGYSGTF